VDNQVREEPDIKTGSAVAEGMSQSGNLVGTEGIFSLKFILSSFCAEFACKVSPAYNLVFSAYRQLPLLK